MRVVGTRGACQAWACLERQAAADRAQPTQPRCASASLTVRP